MNLSRKMIKFVLFSVSIFFCFGFVSRIRSIHKIFLCAFIPVLLRLLTLLLLLQAVYEANLCVSEYYERLYNTSMQDDYGIQFQYEWILMKCFSSLCQKSILSFSFLLFFSFFFSFFFCLLWFNERTDWEKNPALNYYCKENANGKYTVIFVCGFFQYFFTAFVCHCIIIEMIECFRYAMRD